MTKTKTKTKRTPSEAVRAVLHGASWTVFGLSSATGFAPSTIRRALRRLGIKAVGGVYTLGRDRKERQHAER